MKKMIFVLIAIFTMFEAEASYQRIDNGSCDIKNSREQIIFWKYQNIITGKFEQNQWVERRNDLNQTVPLKKKFEGLKVFPLNSSTIQKNDEKDFQVKYKAGVYKIEFELNKITNEAKFMSRLKGFNAIGDGFGFNYSKVSLKLENCTFTLN